MRSTSLEIFDRRSCASHHRRYRQTHTTCLSNSCTEANDIAAKTNALLKKSKADKVDKSIIEVLEIAASAADEVRHQTKRPRQHHDILTRPSVRSRLNDKLRIKPYHARLNLSGYETKSTHQ